MRGPDSKRRWIPAALITAGLVAGGGAYAVSQGGGEERTAVNANNAIVMPTGEFGNSSGRIELFSGHEMTGLNTAVENHCTFSVFQQRNAALNPNSLVLSFVNAPNMDEPLRSREITDVKAKISSSSTPNRPPRVIKMHRTISVDGDGSLPRWEAVTQLQANVEHIVEISSTDKKTGDVTVVKYKVVIPKAA